MTDFHSEVKVIVIFEGNPMESRSPTSWINQLKIGQINANQESFMVPLLLLKGPE